MEKAIISQPMKDKTEVEIRAEREPVIEALNCMGYEVVDTVFPDFTNTGNVPLKYLAKSIEAIADVDMVYFMKGWRLARGCIVEHEVCCQYGIGVLDESDFGSGPFTFEVALSRVKCGFRIHREGWNGDGQYVYLQEGSRIEAWQARNKVLEEYLKAVGGAEIYPHLDMKNAQGKIIIGWAATQTDMLASDWYAF